LASEAAALRQWTTAHTPTVLASDEALGALLLESIEPGEPLVVTGVYPDLDAFYARVDEVAPALGADPDRLLDWCKAFAAMTALEATEWDERLEVALMLADG
jgi:hypothetical protein